VGTEVERANDIIRSSLRALVAIWRIDGAQQNPKFAGLVERIQGKEHLRSAWTSLLNERSLEA
jgi:cullin-associated NEDD8-dissociated protein 1